MAYQFHKIKILLVEDNQPMLMLLKNVLYSFGIGTVLTALDGDEAFDIFCRENPDLVISDWMMSPGDGIALSNRIRNEQKSPNQYVPIILMTGFSEKRRVLHSRDNGITEFLVKPFNARDLYKRLQKIIEKPRQFVRCENFFGPDRRRPKPDPNYKGPMRRHTDDVGQTDSDDVNIGDIDFM